MTRVYLWLLGCVEGTKPVQFVHLSMCRNRGPEQGTSRNTHRRLVFVSLDICANPKSGFAPFFPICVFLNPAEVQLAGDVLFHASAETDKVDVFIGHSWSAGRWQKFLALCLLLDQRGRGHFHFLGLRL